MHLELRAKAWLLAAQCVEEQPVGSAEMATSPTRTDVTAAFEASIELAPKESTSLPSVHRAQPKAQYAAASNRWADELWRRQDGLCIARRPDALDVQLHACSA